MKYSVHLCNKKLLPLPTGANGLQGILLQLEVLSCTRTHELFISLLYTCAGIFTVCSIGAVFRLADGDGDSGRVEVSVDGEWGTICDMDWDRLDTRVLCRQFGYIDGEAKYVEIHCLCTSSRFINLNLHANAPGGKAITQCCNFI